MEGQLNAYETKVEQYLQFDGDKGLIIGAKGSSFKTEIDNTRMAFTQDGATVSYISNKQLYIPWAVVEASLLLGNYYFQPRKKKNADGTVSWGGMSISWGK